YALGERPDVLFVSPKLLLAPWYHARIERALGAPLPPIRDKVLNVADLFEAILRTGRPVFVTDLFAPKVVAAHPSYPVGPLIRVAPSAADVPPPDALEALNLDLAARFAREPWPPPGPEQWSDALLGDYARPWETLAAVFGGMGDAERAKANAQ